MFGLQPIHLILIIIIALIIFGPSRLPELGRSLGKSITEFKDATREITEPAPARPPEDANRENRQDGSTEPEPVHRA